VEIILVLDPDQDLVDFYKSCVPADVRVVTSPRYGLSAARNAGIQNSTGEIVVFIDDDATADGNWLKRLIANYDDDSVVGAGGWISPAFEEIRPVWLAEELDWIVGCSYRGLPQSKSLVRNPIGCNMSFKRVVFERAGFFKLGIGRFGKSLLSGEEAELSSRILARLPDAKIIFDPSAIVYHVVPKSRTILRYIVVRSFYEGLSKAIIVAGHGSKSKLDDKPFRLSSENLYMDYLLRVSIPSRIRKFYRMKNLIQLITILFSTASVYAGFLIGASRRARS
jgi:glycosyltransferase involved in cell wall biosynthesis